MVFALFFSCLTSILILSQMFLHTAILTFIPLFLFISWRMSPENRIRLIIASLPFPFVIPFLGKDGGTVTTLLILFFALLGLFELLVRRREAKKDSMKKWVVSLVVLGGMSFLTSPLGISITSMRYLYVYLSGLFLFLMVIEARPQVDLIKIRPLMDLLFLIVALQVAIGLLLFFYPTSQNWFAFLLKADQELMATQAAEAVVKRMRTLITGPEPTGEMLAILAPIVLSQFLLYRKKRYALFFLLFLVGELLTATRSTTLIFALASMMILFYFTVRINPSQGVKAFGELVLGGICLFAVCPGILSGVMERSVEAKNMAQSGGGFSEILNRDSVWANAFAHLKSTPLFGNGFLPASYFSENAMNFHNLYLTVLFQLGWFGAPFYFLAILSIYSLLWVKRFREKDAALRFCLTACLISLTFFLLNEMKYEFNRHQPYSQFCWLLMALFYLIAKIPSPLTLKKQGSLYS